jgi:exopolysaccharide biosynthesis polyprenyl glycosylphosphotransferase
MATTNTTHPEVNDAALKPVRAVKPIPLQFSERKLLLALMDLFLLNSALYVTLALRQGLDFSFQAFRDRLSWFIILSGVWLVCAFMLECYNLSRAASFSHSFGRISSVVFLTSLIYWLIPRVTPTLPSSRLTILVFPVLGLASIAAWRMFYATVLVQPGFQQHALMIGAGWAGRTLAGAIDEMNRSNGMPYRNIGYQIMGFIDDDPAKQEQTIAGIRVLGTGHDLVNLARQLWPDELIVGITHSETIHSDLFAAILECREMGIAITTMATVYERLTGRVPIEHAGRALNVAMPLSQRATHRFYLVLKRILDIGVGFMGCTALLALIPFVWLANICTSPGPLFYRQVRVGKGGRTFTIMKFRSMVVDAEKSSGAVWAAENDPRITCIGRFLRKTRLDEIPQAWNILQGDMSLIGPRPERPYFVNQLTKQIPLYRVRHAVKPGMTGWAQVRYCYGASVDDSLIKLQYDLYYIKHQGVLLDLGILLKTVPIVLGFKGR